MGLDSNTGVLAGLRVLMQTEGNDDPHNRENAAGSDVAQSTGVNFSACMPSFISQR